MSEAIMEAQEAGPNPVPPAAPEGFRLMGNQEVTGASDLMLIEGDRYIKAYDTGEFGETVESYLSDDGGEYGAKCFFRPLIMEQPVQPQPGFRIMLPDEFVAGHRREYLAFTPSYYIDDRGKPTMPVGEWACPITNPYAPCETVKGYMEKSRCEQGAMIALAVPTPHSPPEVIQGYSLLEPSDSVFAGEDWWFDQAINNWRLCDKSGIASEVYPNLRLCCPGEREIKGCTRIARFCELQDGDILVSNRTIYGTVYIWDKKHPPFQNPRNIHYETGMPISIFRPNIQPEAGYYIIKPAQAVAMSGDEALKPDGRWTPVFLPRSGNAAKWVCENLWGGTPYLAFRRKIPDLSDERNHVPIEKILGKEAVALIRREPRSEVALGLVRHHARLVIPADLREEGNPDKLIAWVRREYSLANPDKVAPAQPAITPAPEFVELDLEVELNVSGRTY